VIKPFLVTTLPNRKEFAISAYPILAVQLKKSER
jgi:hypothetical protein